MPVLGVTGGIATGKSTFVRTFLRHFSAQLFDTDLCARQLIADDPGVAQEIRSAFGEAALDPAGAPDRENLRALVFSDPSKRRILEAILHPRIRARWVTEAKPFRTMNDWLVVEIPLLYETGAEGEFDRVLVVGCGAATQRQRLEKERGLDSQMIAGILDAQWPLERKIAAANHVIWSEGSQDAFDRQTALFAKYLTHL